MADHRDEQKPVFSKQCQGHDRGFSGNECTTSTHFHSLGEHDGKNTSAGVYRMQHK